MATFLAPQDVALLVGFFALWLGVPAWWMARDAAHHGMAPWPWLLLGVFAGPVGVPPYLMARKRRHRDGLAVTEKATEQ